MMQRVFDPERLTPGASVSIDGSAFTVTAVIYPLQPITGRALFRVYKPSVGVEYALKVFDLREKRNALEAVRREVVALNKTLGHPEHFPKAHALEVVGDWAVVLLDWMEGVPLAQAFVTPPTGPADVRLRLRVLTKLASTVSLIHRARLLHRDLKPDNVLLRAPKDPDRGVSIIDFGLAAEPRGSEEGTLGFRAPEQGGSRQLNLTPAVDVFAVGQIACWLLTGAPLALFAGDAGDWAELPLAEQLATQPDLPPGLERVLVGALLYAPERRYRSASDLRTGLANLRA